MFLFCVLIGTHTKYLNIHLFFCYLFAPMKQIVVFFFWAKYYEAVPRHCVLCTQWILKGNIMTSL